MMSFLNRITPALLVFGLAAAGPAWAQKMDKEDKKWLDEVRPIILPEEEKAFKDLKEKSDRAEFQKIFWARRNPKDPASPDNPARTEYDQARSEADTKFRVSGRPGSATDCARVYILLGAPDDVKKEGEAEAPGRRAPEAWIYSKDRPTVKFKEGQAQFAFDAECQFPPEARMTEQLNRLAQGRVVHPNLAYPKGKDGRLVRLADQLPKPSPARTLLKEPRQDFPLETQPKMFLRSPGGEASYVAGLVKAAVPDAVPEDVGGKKGVRLVVATDVLDEAGSASVSTEREALAEPAADGSLVVSFGMALKPGKYTLKLAALSPKSGKGSVTSVPVEVPDFGNDELSLSPVMVLQDIQEGQSSNPQDALADFTLGATRLLPRYGNVFSTSESVTLLAVVYNAQRDSATGKPSITSTFTITRDGKPVAKAEDQVSESEMATPSVGPVPLKSYAPGKHLAQLKVRDNVTKKEYVQEVTFEVK